MRIVGREEFLNLPCGTVFSKMQGEHEASEVMIKTSDRDDYTNDFVCKELGGLNLDDVYAMTPKLFEQNVKRMHEDSKLSIPMDGNCTYRDGLYNKDEKYLIYEIEDIKKMIKVLINCL